MTALLFVLVDAVLSGRAAHWRMVRSCEMELASDWGVRENSQSRRASKMYAAARERIGWWRSLWPLGGGA